MRTTSSAVPRSASAIAPSDGLNRPPAAIAGPKLSDLLAEAARRVAAVAAGKSLAAPEAGGAAGALRAGVLDLTHGTLRAYGRVQAIVALLSRKGSADPLVEALLWCALYALDSGRYGEHVVVDQAVRAAGMLERWTAKGYVNGLLRRLIRERAEVEVRIARDEEARWQHPQWWIDALRVAYPQAWERALEAGNARPPMTLRVNARRTSRDTYAARLEEAGLRTRALGPNALMLEEPVPVSRLPGFDAGDASVQDAGAQRAAALLELSDGQRVLDACAAPGGKSGHILESAAVELTAIDIDRSRCDLIRSNMERLGLRARVMSGDAADPASWWDGVAFDRILADVPCSASGVVRRHPDLKWLRRASDAAGLADRQRRMLEALWRLLVPGGKLLYVTCSVFTEENEGVVRAFAASEPSARRAALRDGGPAQMLPGPENDGFFYALLEKRA